MDRARARSEPDTRCYVTRALTPYSLYAKKGESATGQGFAFEYLFFIVRYYLMTNLVARLKKQIRRVSLKIVTLLKESF